MNWKHWQFLDESKKELIRGKIYKGIEIRDSEFIALKGIIGIYSRYRFKPVRKPKPLRG